MPLRRMVSFIKDNSGEYILYIQVTAQKGAERGFEGYLGVKQLPRGLSLLAFNFTKLNHSHYSYSYRGRFFGCFFIISKQFAQKKTADNLISKIIAPDNVQSTVTVSGSLYLAQILRWSQMRQWYKIVTMIFWIRVDHWYLDIYKASTTARHHNITTPVRWLVW